MKILCRLNLLFLFILISGSVMGQDIITLSDGREVKSKVLEVGEKQVKYKKADNIDGPSYTVNKSEIAKIRYANGTEEEMEVAAAPAGGTAVTNDEPSIFTGKFNIEDEATHDYLEGVAKNAGARILEKCAGRVDNYSTEIYWDQVYRDEITKEINLAIIVKWEKGMEAKQRWVRGLVKLDRSGKKTWSHQGDGGISFSGCAKSMIEL